MRSPRHRLLGVGIAAIRASSTLALNGQLEIALLVGSIALAASVTITLLDRTDGFAPNGAVNPT